MKGPWHSWQAWQKEHTSAQGAERMRGLWDDVRSQAYCMRQTFMRSTELCLSLQKTLAGRHLCRQFGISNQRHIPHTFYQCTKQKHVHGDADVEALSKALVSNP